MELNYKGREGAAEERQCDIKGGIMELGGRVLFLALPLPDMLDLEEPLIVPQPQFCHL